LSFGTRSSSERSSRGEKLRSLVAIMMKVVPPVCAER
jgi:hypothetical protein